VRARCSRFSSSWTKTSAVVRMAKSTNRRTLSASRERCCTSSHANLPCCGSGTCLQSSVAPTNSKTVMLVCGSLIAVLVIFFIGASYGGLGT
jgi:hypothetical protein